MKAKANALRWFGYLFKAEEDNSLRMALNLELRAKMKKGRPKSTWKEKV